MYAFFREYRGGAFWSIPLPGDLLSTDVVPVVAHVTLLCLQRSCSGNIARRVAKTAGPGEELETEKVQSTNN